MTKIEVPSGVLIPNQLRVNMASNLFEAQNLLPLIDHDADARHRLEQILTCLVRDLGGADLLLELGA